MPISYDKISSGRYKTYSVSWYNHSHYQMSET